MASTIVQANKNSSLVRSVVDASAEDKYEYTLGASLPVIGKEVVKTAPEGGALSGTTSKNVSFRLPENGLMTDAWLSLQFSGDATANGRRSCSALLGANAFEYVSLNSRDQELCRLHPAMMIYDLASHKNKQYARNAIMALGGGPVLSSGVEITGASASEKAYLPVGAVFPFGNDPKNALDTQFLEKLYLNCKIRAVSDVDARANAEWNGLDLYSKYTMVEPEAYEKHLANTYSTSKSLQRMAYTSYPETVSSVANGATSGSLNLDCNGFVTETYICVRNLAAAGQTMNVDGFFSTLEPINSVVVNANGRKIYDMDDTAGAMLCEQRDNGHVDVQDYGIFAPATTGELTNQERALNIYKIDWREVNVPDHARDSVTGGVNFGALSSKSMDLTFKDPGHANGARIEVYHKLSTIWAIDSRNGSITVSHRN